MNAQTFATSFGGFSWVYPEVNNPVVRGFKSTHIPSLAIIPRIFHIHADSPMMMETSTIAMVLYGTIYVEGISDLV
jgi:hypothetical protein